MTPRAGSAPRGRVSNARALGAARRLHAQRGMLDPRDGLARALGVAPDDRARLVQSMLERHARDRATYRLELTRRRRRRPRVTCAP